MPKKGASQAKKAAPLPKKAAPHPKKAVAQPKKEIVKEYLNSESLVASCSPFLPHLTVGKANLENEWQRIVVQTTCKILDVPRPPGHCLIPWHPRRRIYGEQYFLLENVTTKELVEPYSLTFQHFEKSIKEGLIELNGQQHRVYCTSKAPHCVINQGESIFVKKKGVNFHSFASPELAVLPSIALEQIFVNLDCLDLVNASVTCKHWRNTVVLSEYGNEMIAAAPTVNGYKEIVTRYFKNLGPPTDHEYVVEARKYLVHTYHKDGFEVPEKVKDERELQLNPQFQKENILSNWEDDVVQLYEDTYKIQIQENSNKDDTLFEEDGERENFDSASRQQVKPAKDARFPVELVECMKLYDGAEFSERYFHFYFFSLLGMSGKVYDDDEDELAFCQEAGHGRSCYTQFAADGEYYVFVLNIDYSDPCFGFVWKWCTNDPSTRLVSSSFSEFVYGLVQMCKTQLGRRYLQESQPIGYLPSRSKWARPTTSENGENENNEKNEEREESEEIEESEDSEGENKKQKKKTKKTKSGKRAGIAEIEEKHKRAKTV